MCVPILRKFRKYAKIIGFISRHMTQKRYVIRHSGKDIPDRYFHHQHFAINQNSLRLPVQKFWPKCVFVNVFGDLDLDRWPIFNFLSHKVCMKYWSLLAKFHKNPSSINGWYSCGHTHKHTNTQTHTEGKKNSLANPFGARLKITCFATSLLKPQSDTGGQ